MRSVGATFVNAQILLDGNEYIECKFENCELFYGATSGVFALIGNTLTNCTWSFFGNAAQVLAVLSSLAQDESSRELVEDTVKKVLNGEFLSEMQGDAAEGTSLP